MKKFSIVLTILTILTFIAVAYAQGPGMTGGKQGWNFCPYCGGYIGPHGGHGMMGGYGMHHGARSGYGKSEECQKFLDETSKERKKLHDKRFEYHEACWKPDTTPETLTTLEKEIRELQEKIYEKAPRGCW